MIDQATLKRAMEFCGFWKNEPWKCPGWVFVKGTTLPVQCQLPEHIKIEHGPQHLGIAFIEKVTHPPHPCPELSRDLAMRMLEATKLGLWFYDGTWNCGSWPRAQIDDDPLQAVVKGVAALAARVTK